MRRGTSFSPADVLARSHQRERSPHHLVRCRQHATHSRARRALLRAGRSAQQRILAGRRRRGGAVGASRADRRGRRRRPGQFAEVPLSGGSHPPARRRRRAADGSRTVRCVNPVDRRRGDADARLRGAARQGAHRPVEAGDLERRMPRGRRRRGTPPSANAPSNGRSTTCSASRTGRGRSTRRWGPRPICSW